MRGLRQGAIGSAGLVAGCALALLLSACGSSPRQARRDGPPATVPSHLADVPDATPRLETIRSGGPNKPYQVFGRDYVPMTRDQAFTERGLASWYGRQFHGAPTASGEPYDMYAMTAAHPTLPIPSYARIRNPANGREIVVRVNDRGPFHSGRIVDLSYTAALKLDLLRGVAPVELERITFESIRSGSWRREGNGDVPVQARAPAMAAPPASIVAVAPPSATAAEERPLPSSRAEPAALSTAAPAAAPSGRGYWVQLGAFREAAGAEAFQRRVGADVDWLTSRLGTFAEAQLYRVQAGPYPSRDAAQEAAARVREALGLVPLVVERR